jgi:hypothetical protein
MGADADGSRSAMMSDEPFGDDMNPVAFDILATIVVAFCGLLVPAEVAIQLELKRVFQEASQRRAAGALVAPGTVESAHIMAGVILEGALVAATAKWTAAVTEPVTLPALSEDPPRRLD